MTMMNELEYITALAADARKWAPDTVTIAIAPPVRWTRARTLAALAAGPAKVLA